ncbi:MAG: DUF4446 family protein [Acidimicrobiia bacterium]
MTLAALILGGLALAACLAMIANVVALRKRLAAVPSDGDVVGLMRRLDVDLQEVEALVADLGPRLVTVERSLPQAISRTGVVVYDAFGDIAGNLSRSIALLDAYGDGLVISLLVGRGETRFFTKQVRSRRGVEELSPEEVEAVDRAMQG